MEIKSIGQQIEQLEGLLKTQELTEWETDFVESLAEKLKRNGDTTTFSSKQVDYIEKIYIKYFE